MPFLTWTFRGDNRPLTQAFKNVGAQAAVVGKAAGKELGNQFKSAVMSYIGAGAIIGAARKLMATAQRLTSEAATEGVDVEALQELKEAAELTGMTIKDLREAAPESIEKFSELMEAIQKSGGILDAQVVADLQEASDAFEEAVISLSPLLASFLSVAAKGTGKASEVVGFDKIARGLRSGNKELVEEGRKMVGASEDSPERKNSRKERREAALAFRQELERNRQNIAILRRGVGAELNQTFGGEFRPETRMMSQPFMMGPIVEQLKAANLKLQELNRTVKDQ
jgi:hypothetical protein